MPSEEMFSAAVWAGDLPTVEAMIAAGADVNAAHEGRMPPLLLAIEQMHLAIVSRLIQAGADVNKTTDGLLSPLMHAIDVESDSAHQRGEEAKTELIELLLESGAVTTPESIDLARRYENRKAELLLARFQRAPRT